MKKFNYSNAVRLLTLFYLKSGSKLIYELMLINLVGGDIVTPFKISLVKFMVHFLTEFKNHNELSYLW